MRSFTNAPKNELFHNYRRSRIICRVLDGDNCHGNFVADVARIRRDLKRARLPSQFTLLYFTAESQTSDLHNLTRPRTFCKYFSVNEEALLLK